MSEVIKFPFEEKGDGFERRFDETNRQQQTPYLLGIMDSLATEIIERKLLEREIAVDGVQFYAIAQLLWNYHYEIHRLRERVAALEGGAA